MCYQDGSRAAGHRLSLRTHTWHMELTSSTLNGIPLLGAKAGYKLVSRTDRVPDLGNISLIDGAINPYTNITTNGVSFRKEKGGALKRYALEGKEVSWKVMRPVDKEK